MSFSWPPRWRLVALISAMCGIATAAAAARALTLTIADKTTLDAPPGPAIAPAALATRRAAALPLRLADGGGVGIRPDSAGWGADYRHTSRAYHALPSAVSPFVDTAEMRRVRAEWQAYVERVAAFGCNAVTLDLFAQFVTFDALGDTPPVYAPGDLRRRHHEALRTAFRDLVEDADARGVQVFLRTDLPTYTTPLAAWMGRQPWGADARDPRFWAVYAAAFDEVFAQMPRVAGAVVRVGEAGPLYRDPEWDYWSAYGVREPAQLRAMLRALLPVFERHGRLLVLRTWTVGVGPLGMLHTDPALYERVLGDLDSPALVVATKYVAGDFFSHLPANPTLAGGRHRRLIEFQARREFEGFSAFPNFLGVPHERALRELVAANPNVAGISIWTQTGGPLRAGPMSLYPRVGPWRWTDANAHVTARLAADPSAEPRALAREWVRRTLSRDPDVVRVVGDLLDASRSLVLTGFYVRAFAERRVRVLGQELPPLLWIWEWDLVGGASATSSILYHVVRPELDQAIAEGFAAAAHAARLRDSVMRVAPRIPDRAARAELQASVAYEASLLDALAWYRAWLLLHHRWLADGDRAALAASRAAEAPLRASAAAHRAQFGSSLDFPAFEFRHALRELERAHRGEPMTWLARLALVAALGLVALRRRHPAVAWALALMPPLAAGVVTSFMAGPLVAGVALVSLACAAALRGAWSREAAGGHLGDALAPAALAAAVLLAAFAIRGPMLAWHLIWTDDAARGILVGGVAAALAALPAAAAAAGRDAGLRRRAAVGSALVAVGAALVTAWLLLPPLPEALEALYDPLGLLPMRLAMVLALLTYVGVPPWAFLVVGALGVVLLAEGVHLRRAAGRYGRT